MREHRTNPTKNITHTPVTRPGLNESDSCLVREDADKVLSLQSVMQLQKTLGNRVVMQLITGRSSTGDAAGNATGMPDSLKTGLEQLSGFNLSDVRVHYNSDKPTGVQALAYAQGKDIHLAPGQEQHLPHEAWHVVQQRQGRVQPTMQVSDAAINDDTDLEREADEMGAKSAAIHHDIGENDPKQPLQRIDTIGSLPTIQRIIGNGAVVLADTPLRKTRNAKGVVTGQAKKGQVCMEIENPSNKWTKVKMVETELSGWILVDKLLYQPALNMSKEAENEEFYPADRAGVVEGDLYSEDGIQGEDVQQGGLGDCWLLAPLAAIAKSSPDKISDMITDLGDGTYTVRFHIPTEKGKDTTTETLVTVDAVVPMAVEDDSEEEIYAQNTGAIWPLLVEKAYAQVKGSFYDIKGGFESEAYLVLTGMLPDGFSLEGDDDPDYASDETDVRTMAARLAENMGKAITISVPAVDKEADFEFKKFQGKMTIGMRETGIKKDTISLTYKSDAGVELKKTGVSQGVETLESKEDGVTYITFEAGEAIAGNVANVHVWYQVTDLPNGLSGGHVYWLYDFRNNDPVEQSELDLTDPRNPDEFETYMLKELYSDYKAKIYIGG